MSSQQQPNILKLAHQMADEMTKDDSVDLQNMDMQSMISHVTKNVMGMMQNEDFMKSMEATTKELQKQQVQESPVVEVNEDEEELDEEEDDYDTLNPRTKDLNFNLNVSLKDLYTGKKKKISVRRKRMKKTPNGYKLVEEKKKIAVIIQPGMRDQQVLRYNKEADEIPGHEPGDIVITLCEDEHEMFERDGNDIFMLKNISLSESFNLDWSFKHLDGHVVQLTHNSLEGSKPLHLDDGLRKIKGEGMPIFDKDSEETSYGDLYVQFRVVLPETLTKEQHDVLKEICHPLLKSVEIGKDDKVVKKCLKEVSEEERLAFGDELTDDEDESDYSDLSDEDSEEEDIGEEDIDEEDIVEEGEEVPPLDGEED
jgi:DnaJ-class molecular chaperone